jgi:hypothetical protein
MVVSQGGKGGNFFAQEAKLLQFKGKWHENWQSAKTVTKKLMDLAPRQL